MRSNVNKKFFDSTRNFKNDLCICPKLQWKCHKIRADREDIPVRLVQLEIEKISVF